MLQILQAKDINIYKDTIEKLNLNENTIDIAEAVDDDKINGFGIYHFNIKERTLIIDYIDAKGDILLYDGLVRSILFIGMMKNIDKAKFKNDDFDTLEKLGFIKNKCKYIDSINDFMNKCKTCNNK